MLGRAVVLIPTVAYAVEAAKRRCTSRPATTAVHAAALEDDLAQVRAATARFHGVDAAIAAGYELGWVNGSGVRIITGCVAHPTAGAMGYHYFNTGADGRSRGRPSQARGPGLRAWAGRELKLVAVEWVVRGPNSNPPGVSAPPPCSGWRCTSSSRPPGRLLPHACLGLGHNPAGMFVDWNPEVSARRLTESRQATGRR